QPFGAEEALRPQPAQQIVRTGRGAQLRGATRKMSLRNRELANLIVVGMLTAIGFASVYIARQAVVSTGSLAYAGFFFALYLAAHLVSRLTVPNADPYLLPMAALLTAVGLTEIYRLDPTDAFRQGLWIVVAVGALAATLFLLHRDYRRLESYKYLFGLAAIGLLVLPALPVFGQSINGARLWIHFGSLQFQPGEIAKVLLIVFLAGYLREKREVLAQGRLKDFGPLLVIWGGAMLVLVETNDLGSALLYFGIFLAMVYVATGRLAYVLIGGLLFVAGAGFSKLLAAGLTFSFALQTFIIVGGILRMIPLTGVTLPFVSYGGSSVVANFVLLAGLLLISNRSNAPAR